VKRHAASLPSTHERYRPADYGMHAASAGKVITFTSWYPVVSTPETGSAAPLLIRPSIRRREQILRGCHALNARAARRRSPSLDLAAAVRRLCALWSSLTTHQLTREGANGFDGDFELMLRVVVAQDPRKSSRANIIANDNAIALAA